MEEVGRGEKHGKTLRCCSSSNAGKGATGAAGPWWHVGGESPGEVLLKVTDESGRNLVTVSLEGLGCKAIGNQASLVLLTGKKTALRMRSLCASKGCCLIR